MYSRRATRRTGGRACGRGLQKRCQWSGERCGWLGAPPIDRSDMFRSNGLRIRCRPDQKTEVVWSEAPAPQGRRRSADLARKFLQMKGVRHRAERALAGQLRKYDLV